MNEQTRQITRDAFHDAKANGWELVVFWSDRFTTQNNRFGYPVCIQLQNVAENHVERAHIVHWSSWKQVCEVWVDQIDAYIETLEQERQAQGES